MQTNDQGQFYNSLKKNKPLGQAIPKSHRCPEEESGRRREKAMHAVWVSHMAFRWDPLTKSMKDQSARKADLGFGHPRDGLIFFRVDPLALSLTLSNWNVRTPLRLEILFSLLERVSLNGHLLKASVSGWCG